MTEARSRLNFLLAAGAVAIVVMFGMVRLLSGDQPTTLSDRLDLESPSRLRLVMWDMGGLDEAIADDMKRLTADDCVPISLKALAMAKLADDLKRQVPPEVAKEARPVWATLLDEMAEASVRLSQVTDDPEVALSDSVTGRFEALRRTCYVCHESFGVKLPDAGAGH